MHLKLPADTCQFTHPMFDGGPKSRDLIKTPLYFLITSSGRKKFTVGVHDNRPISPT